MNELESLELLEAKIGAINLGESFKIKDIGQANWALRKIAALRAKQKEIETLAEAERFRIDEWQERETKTIKSAAAYFESLLSNYLQDRRKDDPKYKFTSPYGKVTTHKQPLKWEYNDIELLDYLHKNGLTELIRTREEVDKLELKRVVVIDGDNVLIAGEQVPGVRLTEQPDKLVIEVE